MKFGEDVEGYSIPVLNEREIRAAAGMLFVLMLTSVLTVILKGNFELLKYTVIIFLTDMLIRVAINPAYSPSLILGRLMVRNQVPEYVGAEQKKFAWIIGVVIAATMFILQILVNEYGPITGILCLVCLVFLFSESAFGICLGCKFYSWYYKEKARHCPGESCDITKSAAIQKTSKTQLLVLLGFVAYIFLMVFIL